MRAKKLAKIIGKDSPVSISPYEEKYEDEEVIEPDNEANGHGDAAAP